MLNLDRPPPGISLLNWNTELPTSGTGDPLGMTLRVGARIAAELLHCITSITPRARYYSFFPWAFQRASRRLGGTFTLDNVMRLVLIDERAMTLGAVLHHDGQSCDGGALQGSNQAIHFVETASSQEVDLSSWSHLRDRTSGFDAYKGSLINLGLFEDETTSASQPDQGEESVPTISSGRLSTLGKELADAYGREVGGTKFATLASDTSTVKLEVLKEFGSLGGLCELRQADDGDLLPLRNLLFAAGNYNKDRSHLRRRMTLLLLLSSVNEAAKAGITLDADSFRDLTFYRALIDEGGAETTIEIPELLADIAERWRAFHFHNYLTAALEALLVGVVRAIRYHPAGRTAKEIIEAFNSEEANSLLAQQLSLSITTPFLDQTPARSLALLGIEQVGAPENTEQTFLARPRVERFLNNLLIEEDLVSTAAGPLIATLQIFALLLRYELTVQEAHKGWNAQKVYDPFSDVGMPTVLHALKSEFRENWWGKTNREVMTSLLTRFVIRQHETMSYEKGYGGSPPLFRIEGQTVIGTDISVDDIGSGNPRFPSAMQVLRDLALIAVDDDGKDTLTPDGAELLDEHLVGGEQ